MSKSKRDDLISLREILAASPQTLHWKSLLAYIGEDESSYDPEGQVSYGDVLYIFGRDNGFRVLRKHIKPEKLAALLWPNFRMHIAHAPMWAHITSAISQIEEFAEDHELLEDPDFDQIYLTAHRLSIFASAFLQFATHFDSGSGKAMRLIEQIRRNEKEDFKDILKRFPSYAVERI
jgi:hypothetical protein